VGLNATSTVQFAPAATELATLQVPPDAIEKSPPLVPPMVMAVKLRLALPVLLTVTVCAALVEPTYSEPNETLVAESETSAEV
jgi:hypothetical protein